MTSRDDLDDLLYQIESHAQRLRESGPLPRANVLATDGGGRRTLEYGDWVTETCSLERVLYEGEGKVVLLVRHSKVDRVFAMKLLPVDSQADERAVRRFEEEARETSLLGHENIVYVTDFGFSPGLGHYYLMEYLNGETLASRLLGGKPEPMEVVLNIAACAGSGLAAIHDHSLVHRDVRPSNLMSHRSGKLETWKVLDFGRSSKVVGTEEALSLLDEPLYVAPEVALGRNAGPAADQFSLAATLFHALFGAPPWPDRTWAEATPQNYRTPAAPKRDGTAVPAGVTEVLMRGLAADPRGRFPTMDDFVAALHSASGASRRASVPPADVLEANRLAAGHSDGASLAVDLSFGRPRGGQSNPPADSDASGSVEVNVAEIPGLNLILTMEFKSARRLRREWRRNMIGGGIFVPTRRRLEAGSPVVVMVQYLPTGAAASFPGKVAGREDEPAPGLAVEIDPKYRDAMHNFVSALQLAAFDPQAVVQTTTEPPRDGQLSPDEKFLLSKLEGPRTVGELRRLFANLPVPVEDVVARLEEKGWLRVSGVEERTSPVTQELEERGDPTEEVRSVLQRAEYLREQGNYLAEIETLRIASERYEDADILSRLATARLQFQSDLPGAIAALERAVQIDPTNARHVRMLEGLRKFAAYTPE